MRSRRMRYKSLSNGLPISEHLTIRRFLKGVYEIGLALPKYSAA